MRRPVLLRAPVPFFRTARPSGFTLLEVIMVMVILGILAVLAAPRLMSNDSRAYEAADQLHASLRYARRAAATRNRDVCVSVSTGSVSFSIAAQSGGAVACTQLLPGASSGNSPDVAAGSGVSFAPNTSFRFTAAGSVTNNAGAAIAAPVITVAQSGSTFATFTIQPDNGFVLASAY